MRPSKENVVEILREIAREHGYHLVSAKFKPAPRTAKQELEVQHTRVLRALGKEGDNLTLDLDNYPFKKGSSKRPTTAANKRILRADPHCAYCGAKATTVDHVVPRARGGSNDPRNLVGCCFECNNLKSAFLPKELGWKLKLPLRAFAYAPNYL